MKAWIVSDLHLEFGRPFKATVPDDADVMICAGDVLTKGIVPSIEWLGTHVARNIPVFFVAGNHEFYGAAVVTSIREARVAAARYPDLHFLENDAIEVGGIRFVGGTLWTDFRLFGDDPALKMAFAEYWMNDFKKIKYSKLPYRKFRGIHAYRQHQETRGFLASELRESRGVKTVVVTHHAPSARSIAPELRDDPLSACYASDLESLIVETEPVLWVHGHVHHRNDYVVGETRVVSNPRGYPGEGTGFDPALVVSL